MHLKKGKQEHKNTKKQISKKNRKKSKGLKVECKSEEDLVKE